MPAVLRDHAVEIELPTSEAPAEASVGADLDSEIITIRTTGNAPEYWIGEDAVSFEELETRLAGAPPARVLIRSERSALSQVISAAHGAGVHDIQLAYELEETGDPR